MRWVVPSKEKIRREGLHTHEQWDAVQIPSAGYYWLQDRISGEWRICFIDRAPLNEAWGAEVDDSQGWRIDSNYLRWHEGICGPLDPPEDLPDE